MNRIVAHRIFTLTLLFLIAALFAFAAFSLEPATPARAATTWHVSKLADTNDGVCNADCSLREAISVAVSGDTIVFDVTGTIVLTLGELNISTPLSIVGPGASSLTINGNNSSRVFNINASTAISGVAVYNGNATGGSGGGVLVNSGSVTITNSSVLSNTTASNGGGIYLFGGTLLITNSLISTNTSSPIIGNGGGIYINAGSATVINSTFISNTTSSTGKGGGIINNGSGTLTVAGSTFSGNGSAYGNGGGVYNTSGMLIVSSSAFFTNTAAAGGGISNLGVMTVTNSSFVSNTTSYIDGAIQNLSQATLISVTVRGNSAVVLPGGGGIGNTGAMTVTFSTISGNSILSGSGAGIYNSGQLTLTNSTVSGNAGIGSSGAGGIYTEMTSTVNLNFVTIANNSSGTGGGGGIVANGASGPATINFKNTIIAGNTTTGSGPDCAALSGGTLNSQDYNLIQNISGCSISGVTGNNITGQDPKLSPLQNNGGTTQTRGLYVSSPAIDHIPNGTNGCGTTVIADQRGIQRPLGVACDIGAFEGTHYPLYLPLIVR